MKNKLEQENKSLNIKIEEYKEQLWDLLNRLIDSGCCEYNDIKELWELNYNFTDWLDED